MLKITWLFVGLATIGLPVISNALQVGIGIADVTGPAAEVTFVSIIIITLRTIWLF